MATSPIYNWPEPDNTDLVKNGALAMRTLGDAIDTTMATMTPKSIVDAKGDLIAASAADTPARLAVGNNGETLVADNSTATGLRYQVPVNGNACINGGMDIWARGTSFTQTGGAIQYTADRWQAWATAAGTATTTSRQTGTNGSQYALRFQRTAGNTNTNVLVLQTTLETAQSTIYAGKAITLSFYARKGADFSGASSQITSAVIYGTGTDQNGTSFTGSATAISQSTTLTTSWQRFQYTTTLSATANEIALQFSYSGVGTAGTNDYFEITQVQLEEGSIATPFKRAGGTIQGELAACQRYYYRNIATANAFNNLGTGIATSTTNTQIVTPFPVSMRVAPTSVDYSTLAVQDGVTRIAVTSLSLATAHNMPDRATVFAVVSSGLTQYRLYFLEQNNNTAGYLGFSAEL